MASLLARTMATTSRGLQEAWKVAGRARGPGIPAPTGQYRVGCVDLMHQLPGDEQGLLVRLHYPTEATHQEGYSYSYWYPHINYIKGYMDFAKIKYTGDWNKLTNPQIPALEGAPVCRLQNPMSSDHTSLHSPVIVFSHGLGAMRTVYSAIACDLASHGYMVACVEHRDGSACATLQRVPKPGGRDGELEDQWLNFYHVKDGDKEFPLRHRQVKQRADDVKKCLDILYLLNAGAGVRNMLEGRYDFKQFKGRMDVTTAAVMGHSFGGGTTVQTLSEEPRFKCGIAMDSWMVPLHHDFYTKNSISQPLLFINSYSFQWHQNVQRMMRLTRPPDSNGRTTCRVLTLNRTHHFAQCDMPFVAAKNLTYFGISEEDMLDKDVAHQTNMDLCHAFLKRHLLKDMAYQGTVPNLDGVGEYSKHIIFGTNLDLTENITPPTKGVDSLFPSRL